MTVININPCDCMKEGVIGHVRENDVTQVVFDLSGWVSLYGLGTVALSVMRQGDYQPYPVPIALEADGRATWTVSATDTARRGHIKAQLTYMVSTKVKKTCIYLFAVRDSLPSDGPAPQPYETWLETLQAMTAETTANAVSASQSAQSAGQSASDAEQSMQEAQEYAGDAGMSARNAEHSARYASDKADDAEYYANLAAQRAERAGYVIFDVDEQTGEAIATVTDAVDEAMTFAVDEANGNLEVTLI